MSTVRALWRVLPWAGWLATGLGLWAVTAQGCQHRREAKLDAAVFEALPTDRSEKWPEIRVETETGPIVFRQVKEKVREQYKVPDDWRILGEFKLPPMEWGGTALAGVDEKGETHLQVDPNPEPTFESLGRWSFYGKGGYMVAQSFTGGELLRGWSAAIGAELELSRFARWTTSIGAEAGHSPVFGSYALAFVKESWRQKPKG